MQDGRRYRNIGIWRITKENKYVKRIEDLMKKEQEAKKRVLEQPLLPEKGGSLGNHEKDEAQFHNGSEIQRKDRGSLRPICVDGVKSVKLTLKRG